MWTSLATCLIKPQYLLDQHYKDPAAVIAGTVLEEHVRRLCDKHVVSITDANGAPRKAQVLNQDLRQAGAYDKNDEKNVTAWFGLRNDAAHGQHAKYGEEQVRLFIASIRDFCHPSPSVELALA